MTCDHCGAPDATIHLTQVINGVSTSQNFCENCSPFEIRQTMQEVKNGTFDPQAQWQARYEKIHAKHPRFSIEAYRFVQESLLKEIQERRSLPHQGSQDFSILVEACRVYAIEVYGKSARAQFRSWGIETCADVGEIIVLLNTAGISRPLWDAMLKRVRKSLGDSPFPDDAL